MARARHTHTPLNTQYNPASQAPVLLVWGPKWPQPPRFGEGMTRAVLVLLPLLLVAAVHRGVCAAGASRRGHCESDLDCTSDAAPQCNLSDHTCGPCDSADACDNNQHGALIACVDGHCALTQCTDAPGSCPSTHAFYCDLATSTCQQCTDDSQCSPLAFCDDTPDSPTRGYCFECRDHLDCAISTPFCRDGKCMACANNAMCAGRGLNSTCNIDVQSPLLGYCVECIANSACTNDAAAHCSQNEGVCQPCVSDADCATHHGASTSCDTNATSITFGHCTRLPEGSASVARLCRLLALFAVGFLAAITPL